MQMNSKKSFLQTRLEDNGNVLALEKKLVNTKGQKNAVQFDL